MDGAVSDAGKNQISVEVQMGANGRGVVGAF